MSTKRSKGKKQASMGKRIAATAAGVIRDVTKEYAKAKLPKFLHNYLDDSGRPGNPDGGVQSLPVAVASLPLTQRFRFSGNGEILRVKNVFSVWNIGRAQAFAANESTLTKRDGTLQASYGWLTVGTSAYISNFQQFLGSTFAYFRFKNVVFHYRPTSVTTSAAFAMTFGFSNDPDHPLLSVVAPTCAGAIDSGGFSFAHWQAWDFPVEVDSGWKYQYLADASLSSDIRLANAGVMVCLANSALTLSGPVGQLWVSCDLEFKSPCPVYSTITVDVPRGVAHGPTAFQDLHRIRHAENGSRQSDEVKRQGDPPGTVYELIDSYTGNVSSYVCLPETHSQSATEPAANAAGAAPLLPPLPSTQTPRNLAATPSSNRASR